MQVAKAQGVLRPAGAHAFEISVEARELPLALDYRPNPAEIENALSATPEAQAALPLFVRLVRTIAAATQESDTNLVASVNRLQHEFGGLLTAEAAAFLLAKMRGIDVGALSEELERSFQRVPNAAGAR